MSAYGTIPVYGSAEQRRARRCAVYSGTDTEPGRSVDQGARRLCPGLPVDLITHMVIDRGSGHADVLLMCGSPDHDEPLMITRDGCKTLGAAQARYIAGVVDFSFGVPLAVPKWPVLRFVRTVGRKIIACGRSRTQRCRVQLQYPRHRQEWWDGSAPSAGQRDGLRRLKAVQVWRSSGAGARFVRG